MLVSKEALDKFIKLYEENYGKKISNYVATDAAIRLLEAVKAVYRPIPAEAEERLKQIYKEQIGSPELKTIDLVKLYVEEAKRHKPQVRK